MIEINQLTKYFGPAKVVDNLSFSVEKGAILGFLGPNGAGKSTTMRMITGFIPPSGGTAVIGGHDITREPIAAREKIGYLPENAPVYPEMTVFGYLDFCAQIRGFSGAERARRLEETIEKCFLTEVRHQNISTLSKGFKQRVCFAQSILHDPEYLILDEPTDGLDPNQKHEVRSMIREMSADKAIILSTHILDEVEAVCTRAIIIAAGVIVADDTPGALKAKSDLFGAVSFTVAPVDADPLLGCLRDIPGVRSAEMVSQDARGMTVRAYPRDAGRPIVEPIVSALAKNEYQLQSIFIEQGRLDEVFRRMTT